MDRKTAENECAPSRSGLLIFLVAAATLLLLALYVLSIGPVSWLVNNGYLDGDSPALNTIYEPLGILATYCKPVAWLLEAYMELFQ